MKKYAHKIEIEVTPNNWIPVDASQLTDDHEEEIDIDIDPEILNGSSWYLDGDYTVPPREIRIISKTKAITIKEIDPGIYRKFKAACAGNGISVRQAVINFMTTYPKKEEK